MDTKPDQGTGMAAKTYTIRITRIPIPPVRREQMRHAGTLPEDYLDRSVEEHDFVNVTADSDEGAVAKAREATRLTFAGEEASFQEFIDGAYRKVGLGTQG